MLLDEAPRQTLTRLTRLARRRGHAFGWLEIALGPRLEEFADVAVEVAIETGDPIGRVLARVLPGRATDELIRRLVEKCGDPRYRPAVPLSEVALVSTQALLAACKLSWPTTDEEDHLAEVARWTQNLGVWFGRLGRRQEAYEAASEAVGLLHQLEPRRPRKYRPALATALDDLSTRFANLGRLEEALDAIQEAVRIQRGCPIEILSVGTWSCRGAFTI